MYACMYKHVLTYDVRVQNLYTFIHKNFNRGSADAHGEKTQHGLSDWFKVGRNQLKARQSDRVDKVRYNLLSSRQNQSYDVSLAKSRAPEVCFVLFLVCTLFWPNIIHVYLILAKNSFAPESGNTVKKSNGARPCPEK